MTHSPRTEARPAVKALVARITNYLAVGGLFNPELMEHEKVKDLLIDCREALSALEAAPEPQLSCDEQFALATKLAGDLGYDLVPEPPHPDTPRDNFSAPEPQQEADERDRFKRGLEVLATTFYKDDQYQDYAKHVLGDATRPQPVASPVTEEMVEVAYKALRPFQHDYVSRLDIRVALEAALAPAQDQPE